MNPILKGALLMLVGLAAAGILFHGINWFYWQTQEARESVTQKQYIDALALIDAQKNKLNAQDKLITDIDQRLRKYEELKPEDLKTAVNVVAQLLQQAQQRQQQQGARR